MNIAGIDINIHRSKRKTVSIFIERDGSVSARVPQELTEQELEKVVKAKSYHIYKHRAEWELLNARQIKREYVSGQSFLYLGRNYRLKLVDENVKGLVFKNNRFYLSHNTSENGEEYFKQFYKKKLEQKLPPIIKQYATSLGVQPNKVGVMELQHRWASCSEKGNINFHWKCAMAPIDVLHYIVAHELAHLIHMNHTPAFWNEVDKVIPSYQKKQEWLKYNGSGMTL